MPANRQNLLIDAALAVVAFGFSLLLIAVSDAGTSDLDAPAILLAALASLPLVARRRAPLTVFVFMTVRERRALRHRRPGGPARRPDDRALQRRRRDRRVARESACDARGRRGDADRPRDGRRHPGRLVPGRPAGCSRSRSGAASGWRASARASAPSGSRELEERALRAEREAERERRLATAEERTRIARDLHDSAGHAINVILVQAGAARLLQERDPAARASALETIEEVARDTIGEIDQLVRTLRETRPNGEVEPPPGLAALETLVERHRAAGLAVEVAIDGSAPPARRQRVDQAAYRILQESLTNASRHGTGSAPTSRRASADGALELTVTNPIARRRRGLAGRARADRACASARCSLGGTLEAGADGGTLPRPRAAALRDDRSDRRPRPDRRRRRPDARRPARRCSRATPAIEVVGEAADGREAVERAAPLAPDVVLMDVRMPGLDGIAATRELLAPSRPSVRVVDPDHVRAGRLHLRRPPRGRVGVPAQAHAAGGADRGDPHDRAGRLAALTVGHAPRDRPDGAPADARPGARRAASTS